MKMKMTMEMLMEIGFINEYIQYYQDNDNNFKIAIKLIFYNYLKL